MSTLSFDGDPYGGSTSTINLSASAWAGDPSLLQPPPSRRSRKASTKAKQSLPPEDTYMQLDINHLDMEGIIDPRVNTAGGHSATYESPIDIARAPWDAPSTSRAAPPSRSTGHVSPSKLRTNPSGVNGTPFTTLDPFGSPPHPTSWKGKGRAPSSISPKELFPSASPLDLTGYAIPEATPYSIPTSSRANPLHPLNTNISPGSHFQPSMSPDWRAPDSWATIPQENERLENLDESSDEDAGNVVTRRPSFAPLTASLGGNLGASKGSLNTAMAARAKERSLPQTPISPGFDGASGKPAQVSAVFFLTYINCCIN